MSGGNAFATLLREDRLMARQFVVHVGAPKTGSSAFQEWAVRHREALLDVGFLYPVTGATEGGNHAPLVGALGGAIDDVGRATHLVRAFDRELRTHPDADVIVSAETMTSLRFLPNMARLHRALTKRDGQATVIQVVRDQVPWRNSCYAQAREMLTPLPPFREYVQIGRLGPRGGNWEFLEDRYRQAGFAYEALAFDAELRRKGLVSAMAEMPSLNRLLPLTAESRREANPSVTDTALLVADQVRALVADTDGVVQQGLRPKLMPLIARHAKRLPGKSFNGFDEELAETIRDAYRLTNQTFARRNFARDWDALFPPKPVGELSADQLALLPPREQRRVKGAAGRVILEAVEAGILQLTPR